MSKKYIVIILLILGCIYSFATVFTSSPAEASSSTSKKDRFHTVTRGDFKIKVLCQGTLEAIKKYDIPFNGKNISSVEIQSIVENQTPVKKGDIIATLNNENVVKQIIQLKQDIEDLDDKYKKDIDDIKLTLEQNLEKIADDRDFETKLYLTGVESREKDFYTKKADLTRKIIDLKADFKQSQRQNQINLKTELSKIDNAQNELRKANQALKKFTNLDAKQKKNDHLSRIENSETKLSDLKKNYEDAKQKRIEGENKSPAEKKNLDNNVKNVLKQINIAQKTLDFERASMRNYMQYGHVETKRNLIKALEQRKLQFENVLFAADAAQKSAARKTRDDKRNIEQNQLYYDVLLKQREAKAQKDKRDYEVELVKLNTRTSQYNKDYKRNFDRYTKTYKQQSSRYKTELERNEYNNKNMILKAPVDGIVTLKTYRRDSGQNEFHAGSKINPNTIVAYVPDLSKFQVNATVPEVYRSMIKKGLTADMYSPAIPDLKITGTLNFIAATVSYKNRWDKNSPKIYATKLATKTADKRLMPGTTINIEINVDEVKDQLFVPIEALYYRDQDICCKIKDGGKLIEKVVKAGRRSNSHVEILEGLNEGDTVFLLSGVAN
ncbi:MAG: efflux RND transporter periplasmic adaptor subunit [Lentisphaeraceae bacterium]|nr:efflux RND transporter periplasmic adaptor subunit [Lentisphaeraceae bacterium]